MHFVLGLALCLALASPAATSPPFPPWVPIDHRDLGGEEVRARTTEHLSCNLKEPAPAVKAPYPNVWAPISPADNLAVWNLLHDPATGLNLTLPARATLTDDYVFWIDTLHTNKSDILPFIDGSMPHKRSERSGGAHRRHDTPPPSSVPAKYARAVIFQGATANGDSQEYMIGPLPVGPETTVQKLDYIFNGGSGGRVPFNARYFDSVRSAATEPLLASIMSSIADITVELIGGAYYGSRDNRTNLSSTSGTPLSYDGTQVYRNVMFRYPGTASYLLPLDFFVLLDCTGTDPSKYKLKGIVTNERFFPTVAEFRAAYEAGELSMPIVQTRDGSFALLDYKPELGTRPLENRFAPQTLEIGGKRYSVDAEEKYVEYMGWSFYLGYTRTLGISIYDVKYKGGRILYELTMQEATAQYAGYTPKAAGTVYHDTYYSLGTDIATLVEGFDCPFGSTFWNTTYHSGNASVVNTDSICLFEIDMGFPVSRHRAASGNAYGFANLGTVKGTALTVRSIATIGNYDYLFDYAFHVDGSLEVTVRASGYLQSSFWYPSQEGKFGPRIQVATQGSLHDHIITYKADFDILGTANAFEVSELVVVNQTQPWFPELGTFEQMELNISHLPTEAMFNWPANNRAMFCVVNPTATNAWGEKRGYRIVPGKSDIHLTPLNSPFSRHQSPFSKAHLAVTRQKDTEPYANSPANINLPWKPQQDFLRFFDDEGVDGEDLVVWFNLGMHHFTRAEDIPVTLYTEAVSSIVFAPQNFNDRAQDGDLLNRRWIVANGTTGALEFSDYGVPLPMCKVQLEEPVLSINQNAAA